MVNRHHIALGTISFTVCFAAWGLIGAFAPRFREAFHLTPSETALLVAIPVLLGSLARIPMGILTDRFGGRAIFSILMAAVAIPVWIVPQQASYSGLLAVAFLLGLAGSSFAIGVGYVSRWTPPERQGSALGIYGLGNIGQSAAVFLGPVLAARVGMDSVYHAVAILLVIWAAVFGLLARNAPAAATTRRKSLGAVFEVFAHEKLSWLLSSFYFLTFGGFVAFSIYLPTLLKDEFHLTPADAGFRTAGFVVLATLLRPLGGWLSDRIGGARVLSAVFLGVAPFALLMAWSSMIPFTVGALGCAALLGLGNGAVFKLVPQYFPTQTGTVTGLVGAMGGLGGFFPPLLLAFFRSRTGAIWPGFMLLAGVALLLCWANHRVFVPRQQALDICAACRSPAHRRSTACRRMGHAVGCDPDSGDRGGVADPAEFRSGAGHLYFRRSFCCLGRDLSLQRLAGKTTHSHVLGSGLGTVPAARRDSQFVAHRRTRRHASCCPAFHRTTFAAAMVDAPIPLLGMPDGSRHHLPPGLRLDPFPHSARRSIDVRHVPVWFSDGQFPASHR
jgi:MFS transporter, NNP family, nitrate/nitrite transporter